MINLYKHQEQTKNFGLQVTSLFDCSDPGTGKTIANLAIFAEHKATDPSRRLLVLCPKTIMTLAWGRDTQAAFPHLTYSIASAENRSEAFETQTDIVIMNHDGINWLNKHRRWLAGFTDLIVDESTAYKNRNADRSKALREITDHPMWQHKALLTGTPMPKGVIDLWHQVRVLDGGQRLGKNFYAFQSACCDAVQSGPALKWVDKPGINDVVMQLIEDITIRHRLEDCIDIPPNHIINLPVQLSQRHRAQYETLRRQAVLELQTGAVNAINAGALRTKLLQLLSGAVYTDAGYALLDTDRYNLTLDLVEQRKASLVAFNWKHQRDEISRLAHQRGLHFAVMDSETNRLDRIRIVDAFQSGELNFILGHPGTMAHGVTLTYGTATIWPSPTDNAEHFIQMNRRVYRNGQTANTETILIAAENTIEEHVYDQLLGKIERQTDFLTLLEKPLTTAP